MFFSKLFKKKDHHHYLSQAGKHLAAERYADARCDLLEALSLCPAEASDDARQIREGLSQAGNRLGELNLTEGEHSVNANDQKKAFDHFTLARELADDPKIRARADLALERLHDPAPPQVQTENAAKGGHGGNSCASCKDAGSHGSGAETEIPLSNLSEEDRFFLLVQPLPGELPGRYAALGKEFARAYLLIHDGHDAEALPILQEMLLSGENDIVIYELALIMYRAGKIHECEKLLNRSLEINPGNATSYLALVHLLAESRRIPEAIAVLGRMMELGILADQAQFMLGELHEAAGDQAAAQEAWSQALNFPSVAKPAAERLVPLLAEQGRGEEAKYLVKKYLKGCC